MSFSLGAAGGGAADALQDILKQRALEQELAERHRAAVADEALRSRQIDAEGQNQSLLQQLHVAQFLQGQQQAQQAELERQGSHIETATPMGGDLKLQDVPTLVQTGRSNLLKAKPIDVGMGTLQTKLGGDASTMASPPDSGGGFMDAGTANQQHQAQVDERIETKTDAAAAAAKAQADETKRYHDAEIRHWAATGGAAGGGQLSPEAIQMMVKGYLSTGDIGGLGRGGQPVRTQILNEAAKVATPDFDPASAKSGFGADAASLRKVQGTLDTMTAFKGGLEKNINQFRGLMSHMVDTGSPLLNQPLRSINENALGNEYAPALRTAKNVALREIARITGNPSLAGTLSDSARQEVENYIPEGATLAQTMHVLEVLDQDAANTMQSFTYQRDAIQKRIGSRGGGEKPSTAPAVSDPLGIR